MSNTVKPYGYTNIDGDDVHIMHYNLAGNYVAFCHADIKAVSAEKPAHLPLCTECLIEQMNEQKAQFMKPDAMMTIIPNIIDQETLDNVGSTLDNSIRDQARYKILKTVIAELHERFVGFDELQQVIDLLENWDIGYIQPLSKQLSALTVVIGNELGTPRE